MEPEEIDGRGTGDGVVAGAASDHVIPVARGDNYIAMLRLRASLLGKLVHQVGQMSADSGGTVGSGLEMGTKMEGVETLDQMEQ
jgi:hypothetical protein